MRNQFSNEGAVGAAIAFDPTQPVYSNNATGNPDFPYFYNGYTSVTTDRYNSWNINGTVNPVAVIKDCHNVSTCSAATVTSRWTMRCISSPNCT